jgi:hypothetical protein
MIIAGAVRVGDIPDGLKDETIRRRIRDDYLARRWCMAPGFRFQCELKS